VGVLPTQALAANRKNFAAGLLLEKGGGESAEWLLSVKDVARALAVSTATVYGLCESGKLPHVRVLNTIRVSRQDLRTFIAAGTQVGRSGQRGR
jgi:excisionase family DNA binding protein